jgi:hypothetical protein
MILQSTYSHRQIKKLSDGRIKEGNAAAATQKFANSNTTTEMVTLRRVAIAAFGFAAGLIFVSPRLT